VIIDSAVYRNGVQIATTGQTSYNDSGLTPSTSYSYAVAAYDAERTAELFCNICNELAGRFKWAESRARDLGWYDAVGGAGESDLEPDPAGEV